MPDRKDWITPEQLAESERIAHEADTFRLERMGEWPTTQRRCAHRSIFHQCPNVARFVLKRDDREPEAVCEKCLVPVLLMFKKNTVLLIEVL